MKYLKYFESEKQFRVVDLQQLWYDLQQLWNDDYFKLFSINSNIAFYSTLNELLLNKFVEFQNNRVYAKKGYVKEVKSLDYTLTKEIYVRLNEQVEFEWLATLQNDRNKKNKTQIVKIYDSEPLEIEDKINKLKAFYKYNL